VKEHMGNKKRLEKQLRMLVKGLTSKPEGRERFVMTVTSD